MTRSDRSGRQAPTMFGTVALAGAQTILQQVSPLLWAIVAISVGGAAITYAFLVYAIWKYRDPATRRRNYG